MNCFYLARLGHFLSLVSRTFNSFWESCENIFQLNTILINKLTARQRHKIHLAEKNIVHAIWNRNDRSSTEKSHEIKNELWRI